MEIISFRFQDFLSAFIILFAVIDITGLTPIIIDMKQKGQNIIAWKAAVYSLVTFLAFLFMGNMILNLFQVDISSFAIAGALVIFVMAIEMLLGVEIFRNDGPEGAASIVPIVFPLIAGAGNQRENDRYDRCRTLGPVIPENLHPEQHLYGHHEDNQRAGNGKRRNIDLKQIEYHIPHKQKGEECNQRIDCRFPSDNILSLLLHIDNNRSKPRYIDYSKQNNKSTQEILKTKRYYFHILHSLRCTTTR